MSDYFGETKNGISCYIVTKLKAVMILFWVCCTGVNAQSTLNQDELEAMLDGLSFLASGGGGGYGDGQLILDKIIDISPSGVTLDSEPVESGDILIVGAGIGSPSSLTSNLDGLIDGVNYAIGLASPDVTPKSVLSVESGPANSLIAMLVNVNNGSPVYDGDGAGRSVPSLINTTYAVQDAYSIAPVAISSASFDGGTPSAYDLFDPPPVDAADAESQIQQELVKPEYNNIAGLALWKQTGSEFMSAPYIDGTYTLAAEIGQVMKANNSSFFSMVAQLEPLMAQKNRAILGSDLGTITAVSSKTVSGLDVGVLKIRFNNGGYPYTGEILSENENLVTNITFIDPNDVMLKTLSITAPTLTSMVIRDPDTNKFVPYNNGDNLEQYIGQDIGLIWSLADSRLYDSDLLLSFGDVLGDVGYAGPICPNYANLLDPWQGCLENGSIFDNMQGWPSSIFDMMSSVLSPY